MSTLPPEYWFGRTDNDLDQQALAVGRERIQELVSVLKKRRAGVSALRTRAVEWRAQFIDDATRVILYYESKLADPCYPLPPDSCNP